MKLHLPKVLRVALLTSLLCSIAPVGAAEITYPDVKDVVIEGQSYTYINVGKATETNAFNGYAYNKDLVVDNGDLVGYFDATAWENDDASVVRAGFKTTAYGNGNLNPPVVSSLFLGAAIDTSWQPSLANAKNITINGSGKVYLGGKSGSQYYSGFIAKDVTISDGATGTITDWSTPDSCQNVNLRADSARMSTLTINDGAAILGTFSTGGGNGQVGSSANTFMGGMKSVTITDGLYVNDGSLRLGRADAGTGGTNRTSRSNHYKTLIKGNFEQTGGTLQVWGKTYLGVDMVKQTGGKMNLAKDTEGAVDYLVVEKNELTLYQNDDDCVGTEKSSMSVDGIISKSSASGTLKLNVLQEGEGTISINKGIAFKTYGTNYSTITQTGGGTVNLTGDFSSAIFNVNQTKGTLAVGVMDTSTSTTAKLAGNTANIDDTLTITAGSSYTVSDTFAVGANAAIDVDGKLAIGGDVSGVNDGGMALKGGKLEFLATDDTTAAITLNNGALTMDSGATVELNFTDAFLGAMTDSDSDGDYEFKALLASGASSASADLGITLTTSCLTWNLATGSTVALEKDAAGNVYLTGELTKNADTTITVDGQEEVINKVEGVRTLVIKTDTTISSDNTHTGGTEVHGANVVLNNAGALGDGDDVSTEGVSSLQTSEGIVAELHAAIRNSGDLTLGGDYSAESGKLTSLGGSGETYICTKGEEGKNGFASRGDRLVFVESSASNASLDVEPCTTLTVGTDKYIVSDEGNAWQLDTDTYYIREEGHHVAMSEIHDVCDALGTSTSSLKVDMVAGELTVDEGVVSVSASGGDIFMKGDVTVTGELSGDTRVAVLAGEATLNGDHSHTGGTYIDGAGLKIGSADALGEGVVYLENQGRLDLDRRTVQNDIVVTGCELHNALNYQGNLTVSGNLTICGTNARANVVTLSGAGNINPSATETLEVNSLVVASGANHATQMAVDTTVTGSLVLSGGAVLTMGNHLTLADGSVIILNGNYQKGDQLVKLFDASDVDATGSVTLANGYGTYVVNGEWMILGGIFDQSIADAMAQANWGIPTASRAFVHAVRGQRTNTGCIADGRGTAWAAVLGAYNDLDGGDINLKGTAVGADMKVGSRSSVGMAIGYLDGEVSPTGLSEVDQEGTYVALYGEHGLRKLSATSCLSADWVVAYGQTESKYKGMSWDQDSLQLNGRLSWNKQLSERLGLRVFGGLEYFTSDSDTVNGIKTGSIDNLRGELGVGVDYVAWGMPVDEKSAGMGCKRLVLHGELRYFNDLDRENPVVEMDGLSGRGENPGRSGVGIDVGATYRINDRWSTSANYSYSTMDGSTEHRLNVGASYTF